MTRRIAVLGGTFDPFHRGHLAIALQARDLLRAEETWIIPARLPPHRPPAVASPEDRLAMIEAVVAGQPFLRACDLEIRRPGPSYTVDTLAELAAGHPGCEFWLVLGADAAREIRRWHRAEELLERGRFLLVNRSGVAEIDPAEAQALGFAPERTIVGHVDSPPISATEVRARVARGEPLDDLVPPPVAEIIRQRGLYR